MKDILTTAQMWSLIKKAKWDGDFQRVKSFFKENLNGQQLKQLEEFADEKQNDLYERFQKDWLGKPGIHASDDGWNDLTAEVVGRGKKFYDEITVKKLQEMAKHCDYHENFLYSFQD